MRHLKGSLPRPLKDKGSGKHSSTQLKKKRQRQSASEKILLSSQDGCWEGREKSCRCNAWSPYRHHYHRCNPPMSYAPLITQSIHQCRPGGQASDMCHLKHVGAVHAGFRGCGHTGRPRTKVPSSHSMQHPSKRDIT